MRKLFLVPALTIFLAPPLPAQTLTSSSDVSAIVQQPQITSAKTVHSVSVSSTGLLFSTADGADTLHVHGYVQADDRWFSSNVKGEPLDTFLFRRIRPPF